MNTPRPLPLFAVHFGRVMPLDPAPKREFQAERAFFAGPEMTDGDCGWMFLCQGGPFDVAVYALAEFGCSSLQVSSGR